MVQPSWETMSNERRDYKETPGNVIKEQAEEEGQTDWRGGASKRKTEKMWRPRATRKQPSKWRLWAGASGVAPNSIGVSGGLGKSSDWEHWEPEPERIGFRGEWAMTKYNQPFGRVCDRKENEGTLWGWSHWQ